MRVAYSHPRSWLQGAALVVALGCCLPPVATDSSVVVEAGPTVSAADDVNATSADALAQVDRILAAPVPDLGLLEALYQRHLESWKAGLWSPPAFRVRDGRVLDLSGTSAEVALRTKSSAGRLFLNHTLQAASAARNAILVDWVESKYWQDSTARSVVIDMVGLFGHPGHLPWLRKVIECTGASAERGAALQAYLGLAQQSSSDEIGLAAPALLQFLTTSEQQFVLGALRQTEANEALLLARIRDRSPEVAGPALGKLIAWAQMARDGELLRTLLDLCLDDRAAANQDADRTLALAGALANLRDDDLAQLLPYVRIVVERLRDQLVSASVDETLDPSRHVRYLARLAGAAEVQASLPSLSPG